MAAFWKMLSASVVFNGYALHAYVESTCLIAAATFCSMSSVYIFLLCVTYIIVKRTWQFTAPTTTFANWQT